MAKKYYDEKINIDQDWGGDESTGGLAVLGSRIQEFIKDYLKAHDATLATKPGFFPTPLEKEDNYYHIKGFANRDSYNTWSENPSEHPELLLLDITIPISDEVGTQYSLRLSTNSNQQSIVSIDGKVVVGVRFTSTAQTGAETPIDNPVVATLNIYGRGSSGAAWGSPIGSIQINSSSSTVEQYQEIDISQFVPADYADYQIRMIADVNTTELQKSSNAMVFNSITKTTLSIDYAGEWWIPFTGGEDKSMTLPYKINGTIDKTLRLEINGVNANTGANDTVAVSTSLGKSVFTQADPFRYPYTDKPAEPVKVMTVHGVHTIKAWLEAIVNGSTVKSNEIVTQVMITTGVDQRARLLIQNLAETVQNYVPAQFLEYAVWSPTGAIPLDFSITDYNGTTSFLHVGPLETQPNTRYVLNNTIEIEDSINDEILTYLHVLSNGYNMLQDVYQSNTVTITVDNREKFTPTAGADFYLSPKSRSNTETNPASIINAMNNTPIAGCSFENFDFTTDGWVKDSNGQSCLRIPAGRRLSIPYDVFQEFIDNGSNRDVTIELDFAIRNVTDEATPIVKMGTYDTGVITVVDPETGETVTQEVPNVLRGIEFKPLEGRFLTKSKTVDDQQNWGWRENTRTHVLINILHSLSADIAPDDNGTPYVRVFINGVINREFNYNNADNEEFVRNISGTLTSGGIVLGQDAADIDVYGIRVYRNYAVSTKEAQQNYISVIPTSDGKISFRNRNAITNAATGRISLTEAKLQYNCLIWYGPNVSGHDEDSRADKKAKEGQNLEIHILNDDGTIDNAHSGILTGLDMKGQGTTAKTYYEWNSQWQWKNDWGEFVDLDGISHGQSYQLADGLPWAKKLVSKINYASSMQSHKIGATALYNDLYMRMCSSDKPLFQTMEGARVAVLEKPFLYFVQDEGDSEPVFQGLCTFGPGKMDKPTWGYDKKKFPEFSMFEGADNNIPLTDQRIPWDDKVSYDPDAEAFKVAGQKSINFDAGAVDEVEQGGETVEIPKESTVEPIKNAWNFCYEHNPFVRPYTNGNGTAEELIMDQTLNSNFMYWTTRADGTAEQYALYRYEPYLDGSVLKGRWIRAKKRSAGMWIDVNIVTEYGLTPSTDWNTLNQQFIAARVADFKSNVNTYFFLNDLLFHQAFCLMIAGTDNHSKNTYYVTYKDTAGNIRIGLSQDDLDTIFRTDNVGWQKKPYWAEFRDTNSDGDFYWEGQYNVLFALIDLGYASELRSTMQTMLGHMSQLAGSYERTPYGCIDNYFFSVQRYFPAISFNETARIRYENAQHETNMGRFAPSRGAIPVSQSLGDQLEAEAMYMQRRVVYICSYAAYGEFSVTGAGAFQFQCDKARTEDMKFKLIPHQWIYPTGSYGTTNYDPHVRVAPGGYMVDEFGHPIPSDDPGYELNLGRATGDTNGRLAGINYYRSIGNMANFPLTSGIEITIPGERLTEFVAETDVAGSSLFKPGSVVVTAPLLEKLSLRNCNIISSALNLSSQVRLQTLDIRGTSIPSVALPETASLVSINMNATLEEFRIKNCKSMTTANLHFEGYDRLQAVQFGTGTDGLSTQDIITNIFYAKTQSGSARPMNSLELNRIAWPEGSTPITAAFVDWLCDIPICNLNGTIALPNDSQAVQTAYRVTYSMKHRWINKWGAIDTPTNALYITYRIFSSGAIYVRGKRTYRSAPDVQTYVVVPDQELTMNDVTGIDWSIDNGARGYATLATDDNNGILSCSKIGDEDLNVTPTATITATMHTTDGNGGAGPDRTATFLIYLYDRAAQIGDIVYADGEWCSPDTIDAAKSPIGVCFWINPQDATDRRMMALKNPTAGFAWGLYNANGDSNSIPGLVFADGSGDSMYDLKNLNNITTRGYNYVNDGGTVVSNPDYIETASYNCIIDPNNLTPEFGRYGDGRYASEIKNVSWLAGLKRYVANQTIERYTNVTDCMQSLCRTVLDAALNLGVDAKDQYAQGTEMSYGKRNTLYIIEHRNRVLLDQQIAETYLTAIPKKTDAQTELENLITLMDATVEASGNQYGARARQLYFPAASICYAYEPELTKGDELADKFKSHNWWLPSAGELIMMTFWCMHRADTESMDYNYNAFKGAYEKDILTLLSAASYWSSVEYNGNNAYYVGGTTGYVGNGYGHKCYGYSLRPVAAF